MTQEAHGHAGKEFPTQPHIKPIWCTGENYVHGQCYELQHPYKFTFGEYRYTIPALFRYDGASVPRLLWTIIGVTPDGLHRAATLIHDYLYMERDLHGHSRKEVDLLFYNQMIELGMPRRKAKIMHRGLVLAGGFVWRRKK
jgi:hypothetical protein